MDAPHLVRATARTMVARLLLLVIATTATLAWMLVSAAHGAVEGPCYGSVEIDGISYTPANDSLANPIVIPDRPGVVAEWEGGTDVPITDHSGRIGILIGGVLVPLASWSGENAELETESGGTYAIDDAREAVALGLVGFYEVAGQHQGEGGSCTGSVMVLVEGNPLTTVPGAAAAVGLLGTAGGLVWSGRGRPGSIPTDIGAMQ